VNCKDELNSRRRVNSTVRFLIKKDRVDTVKAIGLQVSAEGSKVGPLDVVFEASDFFLIKAPEGFGNADVKGIRLNKDLIDAAFYIGS